MKKLDNKESIFLAAYLKNKHVVIKRGKKKHVGIYKKYRPDEYCPHEIIVLGINEKGTSLKEKTVMLSSKEFYELKSLNDLK